MDPPLDATQLKEQAASATGRVATALASPVEHVMLVLLGPVDERGYHTPTAVNIILLAVIAIVLFTVVAKIIEMIVLRIRSAFIGTPWLVKETKNAKDELVITQDPSKEASIPLRRSFNEEAGVEFTFSTWIFVEDYEYRKGKWKHVFHKGNASSWPNRCPGVWLHPNDNALRVYLNTYNDVSNHVDIDNIPIAKWFHLAVVVTQDHMDLYVNGFLKKRVTHKGIPKQNFGDVYVNLNGGFCGYISRMKYYDFAVSSSEIESDVNVGPDLNIPYTARQNPPYLTHNWWVAA
jgi:hypothetical protein